MGAGESKLGLCRARSCKYRNQFGECGYSYYKDKTRTKTLMDRCNLPAGSPELKRLLVDTHPCPLYEHK